MTIDHGRIKALFQAAIDREDPAERLEYLDREIGNDTDLRDRLDDLLAWPGPFDIEMDCTAIRGEK
jgi:hypothetical protein